MQKRIVILAAAVLLAGWGMFYVYDHYFNEAGILDRVMLQSGYVLIEKEKPVSVALEVMPEWIPAQEEAESSKLRMELAKRNETTFVTHSESSTPKRRPLPMVSMVTGPEQASDSPSPPTNTIKLRMGLLSSTKA
ncbi:hypothetical protein M5W83_13470 [Paenibacillus thiaminolyticus]|uniref:Uncharacterized protein n=1 Tax=Paenibacillus thiaminolyticus TaxID=49283 RepID=A0AAP9DVS0_PANTH|nr:hypothetical protein [Paenibacillus thiaminolyticus]MCY9534211.1 hypothetical protein [Paenibacillus thiaminolyticus]MCY9599974.1 hypothetical protein [Paenibacillus thiaminolyticus]MCY9608152.1 hypothetical protein [Paenibacillus thiaminolyticus]MCY9615941.1 hypothetical protein [Paenibacillus thiaminolyticus]MCY9618352.1 hypothetical protein [Paenibacillus thiaminolyticus]